MATKADGLGLTDAPARASRPSQRKGDILAAFLWAGLAALRLALLLSTPSVLQGGLALFALTFPLLFIVRRPARAQGPQSTFWLAMFATFVPISLLRPNGPGWAGLGEAVQVVGLGLAVVALWTLNRSFGVAPAHRGLVTRGVYKLVRHPVYTGELLSIAGYCIGYASTLNWVIWVLLAVLQVARIFAEEKLLSDDVEYQAYQQRVRWRLVPGLW